MIVEFVERKPQPKSIKVDMPCVPRMGEYVTIEVGEQRMQGPVHYVSYLYEHSKVGTTCEARVEVVV